MPFEERKRFLLEKSRGGAIRIDLAKDKGTGVLIGYCVSSLTEKKQGEIDSIYIEADYRRRGIGDAFMKKALGWLADRAATRIIVGVASGNEESFPFYSRYGFYPRVTVLEQAETKETGPSRQSE
jgi:ribosomal protein S18 acetylase RimI-like enzyme